MKIKGVFLIMGCAMLLGWLPAGCGNDEDDSENNDDAGMGDEEDFFMITKEDGFPTFVEDYTVYDNQSTGDEYIFAFVDESLAHTVTFYLPTDLNITMLTLQSYNVDSSTHAPSASVTINEIFFTGYTAAHKIR